MDNLGAVLGDPHCLPQSPLALSVRRGTAICHMVSIYIYIYIYIYMRVDKCRSRCAQLCLGLEMVQLQGRGGGLCLGLPVVLRC